MMRNYIGLSCTFHDPALAIVDSKGRVVFAEATERYMQNKRAINCPPDDVNRIERLIKEYCEPGAELVVAKTWSDRPLAYEMAQSVLRLQFRLRSALGFGWTELAPRRTRLRQPSAAGSLTDWLVKSHVNLVLQASTNLQLRVRLQPTEDYFAKLKGPPGPSAGGGADFPARRMSLTQFNHHLTHAAAACYGSPFDDAVCAVIDGYGEFTSTAFYAYRQGKLEKLRVPQKSRGSLGFFYAFLCLACGFDPIKGEEWKIMGLAPYGKFEERIYGLLRSWYKVDGLRIGVAVSRRELRQQIAKLGPYDVADLACTGQMVFEELMGALLRNLAGHRISDNLVLSGGCALNSSMNGTVLERTPFKSLYVFPAPGDDGNSIGAALLAYRQDHPEWRPSGEVMSPYLGSTMSHDSLSNMKRLGGVRGHSTWPERIHEKTAALLAEGKIVGWIQGRAEFGPRALGNRSILADPRQKGVKNRLNDRVKFREDFRPFAPSILHEFGDEYFEGYQESPYMDRTLRFKNAALDKVPGVVHVNRTGRVHSVKREWNESYYRLIEAFYEITGVPVILNTSFNIMGKPIVHSVEDAIGMFYTSGLDVLVIGDELIVKE